MSNFVVISASLSKDLEVVLDQLKHQMRHHTKGTVDFDKLTRILDRFKKENQAIDEVKESLSTCWTRKSIRRILNAGAISAGLITAIIWTVDFAQAEGEAIKCIEDFNAFNCTINPTMIPDHCRKDRTLEWFKFIGTLIATALVSIKAIGDEKKDAAETKTNEILNKIQGKEQIVLFEQFIEALKEFKTHPDRSHFDSCTSKINNLNQTNGYLFSRIGTPEVLTSYLLSRLEDQSIQEKLEFVKRSATRRHSRHHRHRGEGASSPDSEGKMSKAFQNLEQEVGYNLEYIKIGDQLYYKDGHVVHDEEEFLATLKTKPVLDVTIDINDDTVIDINDSDS